MTVIKSRNVNVSNTTYQGKNNITSVDCNFTPWKDNSMSFAFTNCSNLTSVTNINTSVKSMYAAFSNCTSLVNAPTIPDSVTNCAFIYNTCSSLVNVPQWSNSATTLYAACYDCKQLTDVPSSIPNSVINLSYAFYNCLIMQTSPTIPASVTNMYGTFANCTNLSGDIYIQSNKITNAAYFYYSIYAGHKLKNVYIPFTYTNNTYTTTYNSFIAAGYSDSVRNYGILLFDINSKATTDFTYTINYSTGNAALTKYIGTSTSVIVPSYVEEEV